jgi:hypothetical protein
LASIIVACASLALTCELISALQSMLVEVLVLLVVTLLGDELEEVEEFELDVALLTVMRPVLQKRNRAGIMPARPVAR